METRFRIRKVVFCLLFICLLLVGANLARADSHPLDILNEGKILKQGTCSVDGGKTYVCVVIGAKDNYVYLVQFDGKGEKSVYVMTDKGWVLFWSRESV